MYVSVRRFAAVVLAFLGVLSTQAHAQFRGPIMLPPNRIAINPNPFVNQLAASQRFANVALLGQNLQNRALQNQALLSTFGTGFNFRGVSPFNFRGVSPAFGGLGFGALNPAFASAGLGYGSLLNGGIGGLGGYGGYGGYGYGMYGTQWMQNPYSGYLRGAAQLTTANAEYYQTIQQAKLTRQEAIRSSLQTRRAYIEEAEYERAHMPDPEKIRQAELARELDHARVSPPLTEIWSAKSLNVLLRNSIAMQGRGEKGPNVPLSEDTLKSINLTAGDSRANVGLLKENGVLQWPQPLLDQKYKDAREKLNRNLKEAVKTVKAGNASPDESTMKDLDDDLETLNKTLEGNFNSGNLSPTQFIESKRYVNLVGDALRALKDPNVSNFLNQNWIAKGTNVAALVKHMGEKGLRFAPSTPGDEPAYLALYHALAAFDAGMTRVASTSSPSSGADK